MKPPICKVCQKAHWTYDGHFVSEVTVPEYVSEMARGALGVSPGLVGLWPNDTVTKLPNNVTRDETPVTKRVSEEPGGSDTQMPQAAEQSPSETHLGRPKKHADAAARQRAYRERSK